MDQYKNLSEEDIRKAMEGIDLPFIKEIRPGLWQIHVPGQPDLYTGKGGADMIMEAFKKEFNNDNT